MILFFDVETNGLPDKALPDNCAEKWPRVIQVAWQVRQYEIGDYYARYGYSYTTFVVPNKALIWSAEAENVHHITREKAETGILIENAVLAFMTDIALCQVVVAHNLNFDQSTMSAEAQRLGLEIAWPKHRFCTMLNSMTLCRLQPKGNFPGYKWPKLSELYSIFFDDVDALNLHDASADVACMIAAFDQMVRINYVPMRDWFVECNKRLHASRVNERSLQQSPSLSSSSEVIATLQ